MIAARCAAASKRPCPRCSTCLAPIWSRAPSNLPDRFTVGAASTCALVQEHKELKIRGAQPWILGRPLDCGNTGPVTVNTM